MSDSMQGVGDDIGDLVLQAPDSVWQKIKKALGVQTREQAATLVKADDKARKLVMSLFSGQGQSFIDRVATSSESFITSPASPPLPLAEQMYGKNKAKVTF